MLLLKHKQNHIYTRTPTPTPTKTHPPTHTHTLYSLTHYPTLSWNHTHALPHSRHSFIFPVTLRSLPPSSSLPDHSLTSLTLWLLSPFLSHLLLPSLHYHLSLSHPSYQDHPPLVSDHSFTCSSPLTYISITRLLFLSDHTSDKLPLSDLCSLAQEAAIDTPFTPW